MLLPLLTHREGDSPAAEQGAVGAEVLVVSFSGGRTSAMMGRLIQVSPLFAGRNTIYCFANTGKEREETLRFIHECDTRWGFKTVWLEAVISPEKGTGTKHRVVSYETAIRNTDEMKSGHPFFDLCKKYGIPSNSAPHCTRELKTNTIASYLRSVGVKNYKEAWGIRADEPERLTEGRNRLYPLAELRITEEIVRTFWDRQDFDLGLKQYQGNCDLCFKKSLRKRLTILRESPSIGKDWSGLEGVQSYGKGKTGSLVFDRSGLTVRDLMAMRVTTHPLRSRWILMTRGWPNKPRIRPCSHWYRRLIGTLRRTAIAKPPDMNTHGTVPLIQEADHNAIGISAATKANKATSSSVTDSGGMA